MLLSAVCRVCWLSEESIRCILRKDIYLSWLHMSVRHSFTSGVYELFTCIDQKKQRSKCTSLWYTRNHRPG